MNPILVIVIALGLAVPAVLTYVVTKQAAEGSLKRNSTTGIRISPLTDSDEAWQVGHAGALTASKWTMVATVACCVVAAVVYFVVSEMAYLVLVMISPLVFIVGMVVAIAKARKAVAEANLAH